MTKELIVNADDFGLSSGVNKAVMHAWQSGILTSASLMPGGQAFDEAVELARENPGLQIGLHLTLVQGRAVLPPERIPGLVDGNGNFTNNPVAAGMRYFFLRDLRPQLECEIEAQILRIKERGLPLSHIDGHLNIHMQPVVFDILTRLMPRHGIATFRLTQENLSVNIASDPVRKNGKRLDAFIFSRLAARCRPVLDRLGIGYAGEVRGLLTSGRMKKDYVINSLRSLNQPLTEMYFHPGCHPCGEIRHWMPDYNHEKELAALLSPEVMQVLQDENIVLRNYRAEIKGVSC